MNSESNLAIAEQLDLLAEGELNQQQRKELFRLLDKTSDGWKRCAFAVMEARALSQSMHELGQAQAEPADSPTSGKSARPAKDGSSRKSRAAHNFLVGTLAASLLAMFTAWMGWSIGSGQQDTIASDINQAAMLNTQQSRALRNAIDKLNSPDLQLLAVVSVHEEDRQSWVPVISSPNLQEQILESQPIPIAPDYIKSANEMGWHISRQQRLLAIEQPQQDTFILPLETFSYQFVGGQTF